MRVLITGSRDWRDEWRLAAILDLFLADDLVVVHGACPSGVDDLADRWALGHGLRPERHPARWREDGRGAGFVRNQEMADLGADLGLALARPCRNRRCLDPDPHGSHGTMDCAVRAERAGITVIYFREGW